MDFLQNMFTAVVIFALLRWVGDVAFDPAACTAVLVFVVCANTDRVLTHIWARGYYQ